METVAALLLFSASCMITVRMRFIQFRRFGASMRGVLAPNKKGEGVSAFAASATSLAATLGTGNIAGVAGAIALGGPGAVFWMWMSALAGMGAKYCDIYTGMRFRNAKRIGPMAYMEGALPKRMRPMASLYAALCAIVCLCMGNLVQINAMSEAGSRLVSILRGDMSARWLPFALGLMSCVFVGAVQLGGARRIGNAASLLVPAMSILYIGAALFVIFANASRIAQSVLAIFEGVLEPRAILTGIARGTFSHEAGLGTAAIAHAGSKSKDAHKQALFGVFEVFFDTIVMCTITALAVLTALPEAAYTKSAGENSAVVVLAFAGTLGEPAAAWCITVSLILFALTSVLSFSYYGGVCAEYLFGTKGKGAYRLLFLALLCIGGVVPTAMVWDVAQWANIALGLTNMTALLTITGRRRTKAAQ